MTTHTAKRVRQRRASELLLAREMAGFSLGDHRVDVRGWRVYTNDAELAGSVESLFIDVHTKAVRYLGVALNDPQSGLPIGTVLVPVGVAARPADGRVLVLRALSSRQLIMAPRVHTRPVTRADEEAVLASYGMATSRDLIPADFYARPAFAEQFVFGSGAGASESN